MSLIRVVIADDEALIRRALVLFLTSQDDFTMVGEAASGAEALDMVSATCPDVVLMDLNLPDADGIDIIRDLSATFPTIKFLALTTFASQSRLTSALQAGAAGYLVKDVEPEELFTAIRDVRNGAAALSPHVTNTLVQSVKKPASPKEQGEPSGSLSTREREVVECIGRGMSNSEIATALHVSQSTVKGHLSAVMRKWDVRDRVQVLLEAGRRDYL